MEALNTDLVCDAINTAMRELFLQIVYGRTQSAFSEEGLPIGAGLEDLGKGLRSQVGTMFGTRAEAVSRFLAKGNKVAIEGKLRYSSWERDGQRRSKLEVIVDEIEFMSSRGGQGGYDQGGYAPAAPAPAARPAAPVATPPAVDVYDEDIPF